MYRMWNIYKNFLVSSKYWCYLKKPRGMGQDYYRIKNSKVIQQPNAMPTYYLNTGFKNQP